jgi:tripartite-type tricarboxylate transporter receptor subunit TctC
VTSVSATVRIAAALCVLGSTASTHTLAQSDAYPAKPVRIINSLAAGSSGDRLNRQLADALGQRLKQTVVVDNRPGATGAIAAQAVAKAPADGYILLMASTASLAIQTSYVPTSQLGYDLRRDYAQITKVAQIPNGLFVTPAIGVDSVAGLAKLAKARPGQLTCASTGVGGLLHLTCELFKKVTGTDLLHVPYKGATPFLPDLFDGRITVAFDNVPVYVPHVEAGKLKALAVTSPQRSVVLPNVPTTAELGMPLVESMGLFGLFAPARTPDDVVRILAREAAEALRQPALREPLLKQGMEPDPSTPQALRDQVDGEIVKWGRLIKEANLNLE